MLTSKFTRCEHLDFCSPLKVDVDQFEKPSSRSYPAIFGISSVSRVSLM